jgi:hypothetical protein
MTMSPEKNGLAVYLMPHGKTLSRFFAFPVRFFPERSRPGDASEPKEQPGGEIAPDEDAAGDDDVSTARADEEGASRGKDREQQPPLEPHAQAAAQIDLEAASEGGRGQVGDGPRRCHADAFAPFASK